MEGVSPPPSFWVTGRGMLGHLCVLHTTQNPWNSLECCLRPFLCLKIPLSELLLSPLTGSHPGSRISSSFFKPVFWLIKRRLFFFLKKYFFKFLIFLRRGILFAHASVVVDHLSCKAYANQGQPGGILGPSPVAYTGGTDGGKRASP